MYINFPSFNPVVFSIGPISVHWYGVMYFFGFMFAIWYGKKNHNNKIKFNHNQIETLLCSTFLGACIGGRIGYIIFYNFSYFSHNILSLFYIWKGGMSFHGGLIGSIIVIIYYSFKYNKKILEISDFIVPLVPFGLGAGRLGNFINDELWGRVSPKMTCAMLFPNSYYRDLHEVSEHPELKILMDKYGVLPRHPSQLYEFFLEGIILFFVLYSFQKKKISTGILSSLFLVIYGIFRFFIEFFREPDFKIKLFQHTITMGQILSFPMIIIGIIIIIKTIVTK
ncbi:prolipoprotein diacylglyceryl transferase [Buchnera aphidicola (Muscaphis stroyani)]|uniref:Phosphatidylglycerol--prolipoprotein diacylglyceryl transferase n=1 Tax=Buchnera aphidicola (Muscaphis stroyani) TaxID=1241869 RepID=A0A4D6Y8D0_9GAMM|nr:prolipoprotein diacylglyceryl transferase [Buchnera aphidicola]QCI24653.1 prolipoprotein diacylglyceryl transferase [Buchnera aphidicola (Muscaphis stroyani)]